MDEDLLKQYEEQDLLGEDVQRANTASLCACVGCLTCCEVCTDDPDACCSC